MKVAEWHDFEALRDFASLSTFLGERLDTLSKDELLAVIGFLGRSQAADAIRHASERDMMLLLGRAGRARLAGTGR